jgi:hypothetical protein
VFAATAPELAGHSGEYRADCAVATSSREGQDAKLADHRWAASEHLIAAA